ncbi:MAG: methionyl-tRNA formyltransferase [Coxiellaceae bacterium]|jgi:methionyl-tRNA formyltransferase|nr:methionyl-tRNA formyltransferase [Coxiellaceae bacterium]
MKVIFTGTPLFALPALQILLNSSHTICAVYTQPDRPAGRGQKSTASPVKKLALEYNLPLYQPPSLKDPTVQKQLYDLNADILIDVAYGLLLPEAILTAPKFGCINIHPSLLPRWRGAAPIQRAIMAGDTTTGVTIIKIDIGLDTGDIYKQVTLPIDDIDTTETLSQKAAVIGAKLLIEVLIEITTGKAKTIPQNNKQTTYANKISKEEGKIDWHKSAKEIERMIRAFIPWPIAYTESSSKYIRIWQVKVITNLEILPNTTPGTIIHADKNSINIATGDGILSLLKIQLPGKKPMLTKDILNAYKQHFTIGKNLSTE